MKKQRPELVNRHYDNFDIYIGRGTYWGNPIRVNIPKGDTLEVVLEKYREHLRGLYKKNPAKFRLELNKLSGKVIACSCKPKGCHGDVILDVWDTLIGGKS